MKTVRTGSRKEKREIVCVTGAGGCVGQSLLKKLTNHGYHIKALFRHEDATARYWKAQGCEIILGDLDNQEALAALTKDATKVFHTAAIMSKDNYKLSRHINVEGTTALYKAAAANQCQVFIFVSSISVYCGTKAKNNIFTEEMLLQNAEKLNYYSRTKVEMEHAFPHLYKEHKLPFIIIRPTNIYGPLSEPWVIRIIETFKKIPFSFSNIRFNLVYVDDVTDALIQAAQEQKAYNQTFNVGGDMVVLSEYVKRLCGLRGIKVQHTWDIIDMPTRFFVDQLNGLRSGTVPSFTFSQERFYPYAKAASFFRYQPKITLEDGLRRTGYWLNSLTPEEVFPAHTIFIGHLKTFHPAEIRTIQREE